MTGTAAPVTTTATVAATIASIDPGRSGWMARDATMIAATPNTITSVGKASARLVERIACQAASAAFVSWLREGLPIAAGTC